MLEVMSKYVYGSGNSLDNDIVYIVDELPGTIQECKEFCLSHKGDNDNVNIATIKDGVIDKCFKGTPDELNNAIYYTYSLHEQESPLLIERTVERDVYLKAIRAVRSILSHLSKSCFRNEVKEALRGSWELRLGMLKLIAITISTNDIDIDFDKLNKNMSGRDILKLIAFQIGQTTALIYGKEVYTKDEVGEFFEGLAPYIKRESDDWKKLFGCLEEFVNILSNKSLFEDVTLIELPRIVTFIDKNGKYNTYDLLTEKKLE